MLLLVLIPIEAGSRDAPAMWDSRCEECHGDPASFAGKYLWNIEGQLQGRHHIDDLSLFMRNHYVPDHEFEAIQNMLLAQANSPERFKAECGGCHGEVKEFVEQSIWVRGEGSHGHGVRHGCQRVFTDPPGIAARRRGLLPEIVCAYCG